MRRHARPAHLTLAAIAALTLGAAVACGSSPANSAAPSASPQSPAAAASGPASGTSSASSTPVSAADCDTRPWRAAPVTVSHHVTVPPVPVIKAVRSATHPECGYDRLVLDFTGPVPGYTIKYVSQVIADPSGKTIKVPGQRYLLITLRPAQAHTGAGTSTVSRQVQGLSSSGLAGWALAGDFEGVASLAVGLHASTTIRVGELPGRLYIDVKD